MTDRDEQLREELRAQLERAERYQQNLREVSEQVREKERKLDEALQALSEIEIQKDRIRQLEEEHRELASSVAMLSDLAELERVLDSADGTSATTPARVQSSEPADRPRSHSESLLPDSLKRYR